jgi:LacI family transcriptional regulator
VDDEAVGELATSHLIEQGCRRVAHIRGPEVSTAVGRLEGYKRTLASYNMVPLPGHIVSLGTSGDHRGEKGGYQAAQKLLAAEPRPDGVFCFNDPSALGAMRAILDAGLRIPEDIAVVGCGNLSYSDLLRVPLTSVDQGSESIGRSAADLALKIARKKDPVRPKSALITPRVVVRASSQHSKAKATGSVSR